jgi:hypothetical protein
MDGVVVDDVAVFNPQAHGIGQVDRQQDLMQVIQKKRNVFLLADLVSMGAFKIDDQAMKWLVDLAKNSECSRLFQVARLIVFFNVCVFGRTGNDAILKMQMGAGLPVTSIVSRDSSPP